MKTLKEFEKEFDKKFADLGVDGNLYVNERLRNIKSFFRSYLEKALEELKMWKWKDIKTPLGVCKRKYLTMKGIRGDLDEVFDCGYNQAVSELNQKIKKLKGERNGRTGCDDKKRKPRVDVLSSLKQVSVTKER